MLMWCVLAAMVVCTVQGLQLDNQASTRRPRVTKYSKTTLAPGGSTESSTERSLLTATYRLQGSGGETCILLIVDALLDISYMTKLNERAVSVGLFKVTFSDLILEHAAKQGRRVSLTTGPRALLFPTPVGKSFDCPDESIVELLEEDARRDGLFGPSWKCSDANRSRSETAPVAVGSALAIATAGTLIGYAIWRYLKVKKVQYDTME
ncbi:unnamed protein product [Leptidea sinapis]|uniref:Uncharacterized protein n=1 Tax=Leptidea sinapis TaxID=189913 RepID=A0A5E4R5W4_9NEOP|nr:unnamed protein product [Leptidea sinapis]